MKNRVMVARGSSYELVRAKIFLDYSVWNFYFLPEIKAFLTYKHNEEHIWPILLRNPASV